ncbi:AraC family transcriptional regulator [Roseococcus sp. SYP-B2431]|uniref:helix-turn-helix transcriptional regulator n=1 Tax=Roseococcus sp. SYP-B2431 TaxID=2496640 RepID=UPI001038C8F2|nr:AraC family transcriptional regulator [Roseococcus sp. SYP-B2431]TCH98279.1 AraC family transcriptional regulator [Roseococcus sp. SYP-B2431]
MAAALPAWELEFARFDGGGFSARIEMAMTARMQIARLTTDSALLAAGSSPAGASGAALIMSAPQGVRSRGRALDVATTAPARLQRGEVHFVTAGAVDLMVVAADQTLFERHLHGRFDRDARSLGADWLLRAPPGTADCAERGHAIAALLSVLSNRAAHSAEARHRLQECVMQILFEGLETDAASLRAVPLPVRRRVARAAEEVLRARIDDPPSLRELCELVGVPERTLHHAFQEAFGMAPKAYLRALRLCAAHRRLRAGKGPVTEVAADLGLFHFGRFSLEYRAMFGEPPSETLRRARVPSRLPRIVC